MPSISVYLPSEALEKLDLEASRLGVSRSKAIAIAFGGSGVEDRLSEVETLVERMDKFLSMNPEY